MAQLCDLSYVLQRDDIVRRVELVQLATAMAAVNGARVTIPDLDEELARFDDWLASEPAQSKDLDPDVADLRQALDLDG